MIQYSSDFLRGLYFILEAVLMAHRVDSSTINLAQLAYQKARPLKADMRGFLEIREGIQLQNIII